ncbi:hypothetical protein NOVOSPHI9U_260069 [Novosphingobium sp. 9U]|nr:hypothetical protein NOVOSPHI9U_260069 [Novosphingobium sp. 9U]
MSAIMATAMLGSALYSYSFKVSDIRLADTVNETCHVSAKADDGPLVAEVSWGPCRAVEIRVMSAAELEKAGQLSDLGWVREALLEEPRQLLLTAWGPHAATAYVRANRRYASTLEIPLAD